MEFGNYSVEATIIENGKNVKGTLTIFIDEYVFGSKRTSVDWEKTIIDKGTTKVKSFLFSSDKPYIVFKYDGKESPQFVLEQENSDSLISKIDGYLNHAKTEREEKLAKEKKAQEEKRKAEEEQKNQEEKEKRIREEAKRKAEEEFRLKKEEEERLKKEKERNERELFEKKQNEKKTRIQKEVEKCKNSPEEFISFDSNVKKAAACILDNPYRVLGISCVASNEEANKALDKLKKLARLKALVSYKSPFDLLSVEKPVRDLSIAQNALAMLKDKNHKWFWYAESDACYAWKSGKYRIELSKDGQDFGTYDLFLANYMYAILCDSKFETAETWKRIFNYYCFICEQKFGEILKSRFTEKELSGKTARDLLTEFKKLIFNPLLQLCDTDDLIAVLRLNKYIKDCNNKLLDELSRSVLEKVAFWFKSKEADAFAYLREFDENNITEQQQKEIRARGDKYCQTVEKVFEPVLKELRAEVVRHDMIKESYRTTTYQFMYMLHKCTDKSDAIFFANKTYTYCKEDDRQRIKNTFGEANIKFIDWNVPHTAWDIKGDEYYFGKGCEVDYTQAVYWYHKAADEGNMCSQNSLGICYQSGSGVPQSDEQAVSWFEKAYENGSPDGAYNLAECYFEGRGVKKSIDKALEMWSAAAKLGHPSAASRRGSIYSSIQVERRTHRSKNHICHDIGFQMPIGTSIYAEVTINHSAYAYLVTAQSYQNYLEGKEFSYKGGFASNSPYKIPIPSSNHWYVIIDNGDESISGITSEVKVKRF